MEAVAQGGWADSDEDSIPSLYFLDDLTPTPRPLIDARPATRRGKPLPCSPAALRRQAPVSTRCNPLPCPPAGFQPPVTDISNIHLAVALCVHEGAFICSKCDKNMTTYFIQIIGHSFAKHLRGHSPYYCYGISSLRSSQFNRQRWCYLALMILTTVVPLS